MNELDVLNQARADLVEGLRLLGSAEARLARANLAVPLDESRVGRFHWTKLLAWIDSRRLGLRDTLPLTHKEQAGKNDD